MFSSDFERGPLRDLDLRSRTRQVRARLRARLRRATPHRSRGRRVQNSVLVSALSRRSYEREGRDVVAAQRAHVGGSPERRTIRGRGERAPDSPPGFQPFCTGTLIALRVVATAIHCTRAARGQVSSTAKRVFIDQVFALAKMMQARRDVRFGRRRLRKAIGTARILCLPICRGSRRVLSWNALHTGMVRSSRGDREPARRLWRFTDGRPARAGGSEPHRRPVGVGAAICE